MKTVSSNQAAGTGNVRRLAIAIAAILAIPFIAMQFTNEVNWGPFDFLLMGCLLFGTGLMYELLSSRSRNRKYRITIGIALILLVLYVWAEFAVGVFTNLGS